MTPETSTADRSLELVRRVPLRPIRDDATLDAATAMIDELLRLLDLTPEEDDYLDVLGDLVEKYEEQAHPIPDAPASDVLRYLMDCRGLSQAELAKHAGISSLIISEVLAGKRGLSQANITKLADFFGIKADVFL